MAALFESIRIRSVEFKNRIAVSPMCQYSSEDGFASDWHLVHLGSRAVGGAALVIAEATAVNPEGRISPGDLGLWKDEHVPYMKRIASFISNQNSVPGIQLAHAGRKASHNVPWKGGKSLLSSQGAWQTIAPSAIPFKEGDPIPQELTVKQIRKIINDFQVSAERALDADFKVIEIHGAHGYLINEFLSPLSNSRTDAYGGSFTNRCRFLIEIVLAIREVWPLELPLFVRISATDWTDQGWKPEDSVNLAKILKDNEVDLVDCSSGGNVHAVKIPVASMYQVPLAEKVRREAKILTAAVGLISTPGEAESIIQSGKADFVFMARELLRNPYFPLHAARQLGVELQWPVQYERAKT
jgi:2,4-dienoyl-CoA reductase-like NADH-dependent reductase (Old Yellow Enzyme family)